MFVIPRLIFWASLASVFGAHSLHLFEAHPGSQGSGLRARVLVPTVTRGGAGARERNRYARRGGPTPASPACDPGAQERGGAGAPKSPRPSSERVHVSTAGGGGRVSTLHPAPARPRQPSAGTTEARRLAGRRGSRYRFARSPGPAATDNREHDKTRTPCDRHHRVFGPRPTGSATDTKAWWHATYVDDDLRHGRHRGVWR